jgi:DNA-binding beta-propeller fold protein YncE
MTTSLVTRWLRTVAVFASLGALVLHPPVVRSEQAGEPAGRIAIASKAPGLITVIGVQAQATRTFRAGYLPHEVAAAGPVVFISNYGGAHVRSSDLTNEPGNTLSVVDLTQPESATETIDLGSGRCAPHGLAASRDRQRLYVTCEGRMEVVVVDVPSRTIVHTIPTHQAGSHMIVVSADGSRAYVSNFWHGTVSVLDLRSRRILAQVLTGAGTEGIGLSPDGRYAYASSVYVNEVLTIDTTTLQVTRRAVMPNCLGAVRVVPTPGDGRTLVVNCADNGRVLLVDSGTFEVRREIPVGTGVNVRCARRLGGPMDSLPRTDGRIGCRWATDRYLKDPGCRRLARSKLLIGPGAGLLRQRR